MPSSVAGLFLDLDPSVGITLNAGNVARLADQSGAGDSARDAVQTDPAKQPPYLATDPNYAGRASVTIPLGRWLATGLFAGPPVQPFTTFFVGHTTDGIATPATFYDGGPAQIEAYEASGTVGLAAGLGFTSSFSTHNTPSILCAEYSGPASTLSKNKVSPNATGNAGPNAPGKIIIGANVFGANSLVGSFARILLYARPAALLTVTEKRSIIVYLGARYGIAVDTI